MKKLLIAALSFGFLIGLSVLGAGDVKAWDGITVPDGWEVEVFATGFSYPLGLAVNSDGDLFVSDNPAHTIYRVTPAGVKSAFVTTSWPDPLAFDAAGNLYVGNTGGRGI